MKLVVATMKPSRKGPARHEAVKRFSLGIVIDEDALTKGDTIKPMVHRLSLRACRWNGKRSQTEGMERGKGQPREDSAADGISYRSIGQHTAVQSGAKEKSQPPTTQAQSLQDAAHREESVQATHGSKGAQVRCTRAANQEAETDELRPEEDGQTAEALDEEDGGNATRAEQEDGLSCAGVSNGIKGVTRRLSVPS